MHLRAFKVHRSVLSRLLAEIHNNEEAYEVQQLEMSSDGTGRRVAIPVQRAEQEAKIHHCYDSVTDLGTLHGHS